MIVASYRNGRSGASAYDTVEVVPSFDGTHVRCRVAGDRWVEVPVDEWAVMMRSLARECKRVRDQGKRSAAK